MGVTGAVLALEVRRGSGAVAGVMARRAGVGPAGVPARSSVVREEPAEWG